MTIALWIIAICSIVRIVQNSIQLSMMIGEREQRKRLNNEFIDSLRKDNREWAEDMLQGFLEAERAEPDCETCKFEDEPRNYPACQGCRAGRDRYVPKQIWKGVSDGNQ